MVRMTVLAMVMVALPMGSAYASEQGGAAAGEKVFVAQKCSLCHAVAGKGNKNGALDAVGSKLTAAEIREWLVTPVEMAKKHNATRKPPMKSYASLSKEDLDGLVAYLQTLKK